MKFYFEANLEYQWKAIHSVVDLFEGNQNSIQKNILLLENKDNLLFQQIYSIGNSLSLSKEEIYRNLCKIQKENKIDMISEKKFLENGYHFTVEMETGTGKTYVYLRTIYELNKKYGFKKFVIVVPSLAIREGVLKTIAITFEHFQNLYDNIPVNYYVYDSSKISNLREFASNNNIEILIINIDSFAKDENIIYRPNDKLSGIEPIQFIQATHPIVIVDEPQNMETYKRKAAIMSLNPLCTLRYSATHKYLYNLVYSLDPVKAYDLGLVKQIEVDSVLEENSLNDAFISVEEIISQKKKIIARLTIYRNEARTTKKKTISVKIGDDLYVLSNNRHTYKEGFIVEEIDAINQTIKFSNGCRLSVGTSQGGLRDEIIKFQIERTIEEHLNKELELYKRGIKVLSLFFIDRVANYRFYDKYGKQQKGKIAQWFEEAYFKIIHKEKYQNLFKIFHPDGCIHFDKIHNGYFSLDRKGKPKDTKGESKDDVHTYDLIMKDKEKLLDIDNPLRFIFSHTALREGWDNPNVFQICTLNETKSDIKKRQEIGRGLRLAVNQQGVRLYDKNINRLTIIANESYEDFANKLQKEIEEECNVSFQGRIKNKKEHLQTKYNEEIDINPEFLEIWEKIRCKTLSSIEFPTKELIQIASKKIYNLPPTPGPALHSSKVNLNITKEGIDTSLISKKRKFDENHKYLIPDIFEYIQQKTELTRNTISQILQNANRWDDFYINPQYFLDQCVTIIQETLTNFLSDGIKYEKISNDFYEMRLFKLQEIKNYLDEFTFEFLNRKNTLYEHSNHLGSDQEIQFTRNYETNTPIEFYFRLPSWFRIPTPIGNYKPARVIIFKNGNKIYFFAETKSTNKVDILKFSPMNKPKSNANKNTMKLSI